MSFRNVDGLVSGSPVGEIQGADRSHRIGLSTSFECYEAFQIAVTVLPGGVKFLTNFSQYEFLTEFSSICHFLSIWI